MARWRSGAAPRSRNSHGRGSSASGRASTGDGSTRSSLARRDAARARRAPRCAQRARRAHRRVSARRTAVRAAHARGVPSRTAGRRAARVPATASQPRATSSVWSPAELVELERRMLDHDPALRLGALVRNGGALDVDVRAPGTARRASRSDARRRVRGRPPEHPRRVRHRISDSRPWPCVISGPRRVDVAADEHRRRIAPTRSSAGTKESCTRRSRTTRERSSSGSATARWPSSRPRPTPWPRLPPSRRGSRVREQRRARCRAASTYRRERGGGRRRARRRARPAAHRSGPLVRTCRRWADPHDTARGEPGRGAQRRHVPRRRRVRPEGPARPGAAVRGVVADRRNRRRPDPPSSSTASHEFAFVGRGSRAHVDLPTRWTRRAQTAARRACSCR